MGYTKHDYQSNDILYAADLAEMDNQIYKNEQDILKLEENKQPAGNYASSEEVSELRSDLNDLSNMKSGAIIQTASGESIVTTDSSDNPLKGLRVFGKTEQFTTTGKNLFNETETPATEQVSLTKNGSKFTIKTTSEVTIDTVGRIVFSSMVFDASKSYTISFDVDSTEEIFVGWYGCYKTLKASGKKHYSVTLSEITTNSLSLGITIPNTTITFSNIQIEEGTVETSYEPYTGGIPSPNPQYKQDLVSVGDDGDVEVGVYGGNLFDKNNARYVRGIACESQFLHFYNNGLQHVRMYYMDAEPNTSYFISKTVGVNLRVCTCPEIPSDNGSITSINANTSENSCVMTTGSEDKYIAFYLLWTAEIDSGITYESVMDTLMVAKGDTYVPYEPYHKQSLTTLTPNGLPGIKVTDASLATYTDSDGNMWVADEIDFERGVYVQRVGIEVFDGSDDEYWYHDNGLNRSITEVLKNKNKLPTKDDYTNQIACTSLIPIRISDLSNGRDGITISTNGFVSVRYSEFDSKEKWMEYMNSSPMVVQYILATPIETPLTAEELTQYKALHTNYPTTTIISDAHMDVKYGADTKNYIDNKFAELQTAIVALGGI